MRGSQLAVAALLASLMSAVGSRLPQIGAFEGGEPTAGIESRNDEGSGATDERIEKGSVDGRGVVGGKLEATGSQGNVRSSGDHETGASSSSIFHGASLLGGTGLEDIRLHTFKCWYLPTIAPLHLPA